MEAISCVHCYFKFSVERGFNILWQKWIDPPLWFSLQWKSGFKISWLQYVPPFLFYNFILERGFKVLWMSYIEPPLIFIAIIKGVRNIRATIYWTPFLLHVQIYSWGFKKYCCDILNLFPISYGDGFKISWPRYIERRIKYVVAIIVWTPSPIEKG